MQRRFRVDAVPFFGVPAVKRHVFTLRSLHIQFVQAFSLLCFQRDRFASFAGIERQRINGLLKRQLGEAVFTCGADGQSKIVACKVLREIVCVAGQNCLFRRSADADVRLLVKAQIADLECSSFIQPEVILRVLRAVAGDAGRAAQLERTGAVHAAAQDLLFGGLHFARQAVARDDAAVQHGGGVLRNDNACAIAACVINDVHVCQIKLVIIAHADRACCCAGDPATGKRVLFACRDIGLLPGIAAVVKDKRAVFVDVIIAGAVRSVAVGDGKDGRLRVLIAHGDEDDAALSAIRQTERVAVQAERDLRAVFGHAERLFKSQIIRQIIAAGFQLSAGHGQRRKGRLFAAVLAVCGVDVVLFAVLRGCFFPGGLIRLLRVRRDSADAPNSQHQRKHQQQTDPSLLHFGSSSYCGADYVYRKSSIFFLLFQRFSHVLSKY